MARKKRKFLSDDDDDEDSDASRGSDSSDQKARDWAKAPAFISGAKVDLSESMDMDKDVGLEESSSDSEESEQEVQVPTPLKPVQPVHQAPTGPLPTAFGQSRVQRAFLRNVDSASSSRPETPLSASERAHFNKISGSIGARMLAKMGWQAGTGLGATSEGIVTPVESKIRPQKMGIAFKGFKEKTEQSKAEALRRGEVVSDDEERRGDKKTGAEKAKRSDAWRKPKKIKVKVEHKSYEEILAEIGQAEVPNIGQIIDARGAIPREVSSLADLSIASWTPSTDSTRIPELRHNLRLISEASKTDVDGLAREAKALENRRKFLTQEDARLRKKVAEEAELISRLQQVHLIADEISDRSKELEFSNEPTLEPFTKPICTLLDEYPKEFEQYNLDETVVAAIAPLFRRMVAHWQPLEEPSQFMSTFKTWRKAIRLTNFDRAPTMQVDAYGTQTTVIAPVNIEKPMTPFDSLFWNVWLPKVRSCINNEWSPLEPQPAVQLYETWSNFLPDFVRDNILDQLVLPKVHKTITDWNPRNSKVSLKAIVFPWLPHLGLRLEDFIGDSRRKVKNTLRAWSVGEPMPVDLKDWREVFDQGEWETIMLKYVVPKLGATLRNDFRINPRDQDMEPLQRVLSWTTFMKPSVFARILTMEFFPKWLDVLHRWLIQPTVNFEEVAQWYQLWKGTFSEDVQKMEGISRGFMLGLQLMNKAIELGPDAPSKLARPDHSHLLSNSVAPPKVISKSKPSWAQEVTFRSIVEEFAASHNLLFMPTGKTHETSRMPLYRVSRTADGKGGILVYILDDAVWTSDGDRYRAISLEDMVLKANA